MGEPFGIELVARAFAALFDGLPVVIEAARPALALDALFPEERRHVAQAVPKRQAEWATGRICARAALARLGFAPVPILPGADRCPVWPPGVVGSVTHTDTVCAVAVARAADIVSLGIDLERDVPLDADLEPLICTPAERRWLDAQNPAERGLWSKLVFSAKESFYKCQYPTTGRVLDFLDVELFLDPGATTFSARTRDTTIAGALAAAQGRWARAGGFLLTRTVLLR